MDRLTNDAPLPDRLRGGVIALGNFDGFHRGHQAVVARARERARAEGRPLIVATFDPHPVRFFRPDAPPFRLTTLDQRARLFAEAGADAMLVFRFDAELAGESAEQFVRERIAGRTGAAAVVTGQDFTFGKARGGNVAVLAELGEALGIATEAVAPVADAEGQISSSRIRDALQRGDCEAAAALLTRPFAIEGVVIHGDKVGRQIGFPTANIDMGDYLRPAYGIYAVRGRLPGGRVVGGAANLGIRPSFDPPKELLEPYFFDYSGSLYGETIAVELVSFIRPELRFDGLEALKAQIDADCAEAARRLAAAPPLP
ncbi:MULTISPECIES: bifunctional riboflavin kinase/FAD synthetase [Edaphosphingomonas]|uniref:Riboflavin biosynthesis protein n=2 Tax=Edaphosphingomonas TaxID=3423724 RepID=A0A2T4HT70_9SPHN|nr:MULTISPECIES: bifunctional riboflavin kinase/FAD synthetase [Sphingomonas]OHT22263.1 Riboflavin biosynthesis protein RibF [Sphingomonas haloaromaticamans]PTD18998.1 bifunctional riboflavin kinase/FAD synthetase [Sphingomonas fennica]